MAAEHLKPYHYKPGQSGFAGGRRKIPEHLRLIMSLSQDEVSKIVALYGRMTRDELQVAINNPKTPVIEIAVASIFANAAKHGDYGRLGFLLDRAIGKAPVIPDEVDPDGELSKLTDAELVARIRRFLPKLEKTA